MPPRHDADAAVIVGCIALGISSCSCTVHPRALCSVDLQLKLAGTLNPQYLPPSGCSPPPASGDCQSGVLLMVTPLPLCGGGSSTVGGAELRGPRAQTCEYGMNHSLTQVKAAGQVKAVPVRIDCGACALQHDLAVGLSGMLLLLGHVALCQN